MSLSGFRPGKLSPFSQVIVLIFGAMPSINPSGIASPKGWGRLSGLPLRAVSNAEPLACHTDDRQLSAGCR